MKNIILSCITFMCAVTATAQHIFKATIKDANTNETLIGVSAIIKHTTNGSISDANGLLTISNIPEGTDTLVFSFIGYETLEKFFYFPLIEKETVVILSPSAGELEVVVVEATRGNRTIANIPTRVEVLTEEIDEASTMDPSKVAHLLTHSTGIQVQQTSATSNTANVRIQGLDGRYTQILKDGFPLYGGFSGSLSIMQIPPLDLRQVEYIKGSASTLYGGGAISGLINLISKEPDKEETLLHINGSHIGAFDVNTFVSRKMDKVGFTLLAQRNTQLYFDADKDGYTDLPQLTKYNLNPKLFFYINKKTNFSLGATLTNETRQGGDVHLIAHTSPDTTHFYKEQNDVSRVTTQFKLNHSFNERNSVTIRNSVNIFHRGLEINSDTSLKQYKFSGDQYSTFSELSFTNRIKENVLILGLNFYTDQFKE